MPTPEPSPSVIREAALLNGALPAYPARTTAGTAFWAGYAAAAGAPAGTGAAGIRPRHMPAWDAGQRRKKVEPGINTGTDPRVKLPAAKSRW